MTTDTHARTAAAAVGRAIGREADALLDALPAALARQWLPSPVPRPRDDTTQRASGAHPDPTADTVLDARRLGVREAVGEAQAALRAAGAAVDRLARARALVAAAVARYDGGTDSE